MGNAADGLSPPEILGYLVRASLGATTAHHLVEVQLYEDILAGEVKKIALSPRAAFALAANLVTAARAAEERQIWDLQGGICERCQNLRSVELTKPGHSRPERVRCPECGPRLDSGFLPTIPALEELERAVLAK